MMSLRLRPAIIGAVCVFAIGGSAAAAQAGRIVLAGSGVPSPTGDFSCVHEDHGRIDNDCGGFDAHELNWNVPLPVDYPGTRTVTFNGSGNADPSVTQTRCQPYTVSALGVVSYTVPYTTTTTAIAIAPYTTGVINVVANAALGIQCFVPSVGITQGGRLISFEYTP